MSRKKTTTNNIIDVIKAEVAADPALAKAIKEESFNADIARQVYECRTNAGLTQSQLAESVGTKQSVIARIEDNRYGGPSLAILRRIADALKLRLEVRFCKPAMTSRTRRSFATAELGRNASAPAGN